MFETTPAATPPASSRALVAQDSGMHGPARLLGPDGLPMLPARRDLEQEVAGPTLIGTRSFWDETVASGLTPERLARLLRESVRGDTRAYLTLAEEIEERDLHYQGVLGVRKRAIAGIRPSVDPVSEKRADKKVAEAVRGLIEETAFTDLIEDLMDAVGKGYSVVEIQWGERDGQWRPVAYDHRDPRYFTFDYVSRSDLRLADIATIDGTPLPPAKFIRHLPRLKTGIPIRAGLARGVAWGFLFKSFSVKNWGAFLDVYGMPLRVGKYHPAASEKERGTLLRAVAGIASDAAAIIPESMMIEFIEAKQTGGVPYENMCRFWDEQVSKVVLGQTMTTDNGSSMAQAKVHNEVRIDIVEWDGRQLARTINRDLIAWFVALNFGQGAAAPLVCFPMPKREDVAVKSAALAQLVPLGLEVAQDDVRELVGVPAPKEGAKLLTAPAPAAAAPGKPSAEAKQLAREAALNSALRAFGKGAGHAESCGCGACAALNERQATPRAPVDDVDAIGIEEADDWEAQTGTMGQAIVAAAARSSSYGEFRARLQALVAGLDTGPLAARLAIASMKARGLGAVTDDV